MNHVSEHLEGKLEITSSHWRQMKEIIFSEWDYKKTKLSTDLEFRFIPMPNQSYSALLSYRGVDVFHFMWTEVDGIMEITHRIVHPDFRGQGIGTAMMSAIEERAQQLADAKQIPIHLLLETSQLSVVNLGKKCGMTVSKGKSVLDHLENYNMDENSHVRNENGYQMMFRLSKKVSPEKKSHLDLALSSFRIDILKVLAPAA
jgi:GNAT superfamily N-acetyltransferase